MPNDRPSGGFSVILGNPPWERVKLQEKEFFASRDPEIASARNAAARKRLIKALPETNPQLSADWQSAQRRANGESHLLRNSGAFPLGGVGDVNTYAVFADLFRQKLSITGQAGLILPTGLVTGYTYRGFLGHLLESRTLVSFYGFENEDKLFPEVHNETKFGLLTISGTHRPVKQIQLTAHVRQPASIDDPERRYSLTIEQIEQINPNTKAIPSFRLTGDAEVSATIHAAAPVLVRKRDGQHDDSAWGMRFQRMFDMANDSGLFLDHSEVAPLILRRSGVVAELSDGSRVVPLYEGKMFWHFNHRYGTYEGQTQRQANKGVLPRTGDEQLRDPYYRVQPRYWVTEGNLKRAMGEDCGRTWLLAWRDVGISERTFIVSPIPATAVGHNAPVMYACGEPGAVVALSALLSSLVADYDARQKSYRMTYSVVEQIAIPTPKQLGEPLTWMGETPQKWLAKYAVALTYTSHELEGFAVDAGYRGAPFEWNSDHRAMLQAELDAAVMHLYRLDRAQAEWILDSFSVLKKYERRDCGEFRTKRRVLEAYDLIGMANLAGSLFESKVKSAFMERAGWITAVPAAVQVARGMQIAYILALLEAWQKPVSKPLLERGLVLMLNDGARRTILEKEVTPAQTAMLGGVGEFVRGVAGLYDYLVSAGLASPAGQTGLAITPMGTSKLGGLPQDDRGRAAEVIAAAQRLGDEERFIAAVGEVTNERYELV